MVIALFGNRYQGDKIDAVSDFICDLGRHSDIVLLAEVAFLDFLVKAAPEAAEAVTGVFAPDRDAVDLALSFGGDGTFLAAAGMMAGRETPLMGINTGHLGYLAGASIDEAHAIVDDLIAGHYIVERRTMLKVECGDVTLPFSPYALNEVAILKQDSASMITVDTSLDSQPLALYQADGLLISTPTGSTAYNLSAGGPIIDPEARVWVLSPIAPHSLTMRPLVVKDSGVVAAVPVSRTATFRLSVDGRSVSLPSGIEIVVTRAPFDTLLVRQPHHNYLDTLRSKLLWGK